MNLPTPPIPSLAAQYLRMSTEHQQYSLANQNDAIQAYARQHGFKVIQTYSDSAKSGLVLKNRHGLGRLLRDVMEGRVGYKTVLVYDVSRWGRFQDDDEAACYEFLCRRSGISVCYCAETFANDGSASGSIMKHLRRLMAAEFSRELGNRVLDIQAQYAKLGFWNGGPPPFGFNRVLVSSDKKPIRVLGAGERKGDYRTRIMLAPASSSEVSCVRLIFRLLIEKHMNCRQIAEELRKRGSTRRGTPWRAASVRAILTRPLYTGCNTWNRTTHRLHTRTLKVEPEHWIRAPHALMGFVKESEFNHAQRILTEGKWPEAKLLRKMRTLIRKGLTLTNKGGPRFGAPSASTLALRYGSIIEAYKAIGHDIPTAVINRADHNRASRILAESLMEKLIALSDGRVTAGRGWPRLTLLLNNGLEVSVGVACSRPTLGRGLRWNFSPRRGWDGPVLFCRLNEQNDGFHSMYVLPQMIPQFALRIREDDEFLSRIGRLEKLTDFYEAVSVACHHD